MLQSIRDRTQGWIAGVIISLLILSFALWGIHSYMGGAGDTSVIAKVNGVEIFKPQWAAAYERLRRQAQGNLGTSTLPQPMEAELKSRALQAIINMQVLEQGSLKQNFRVSSAQIDNFLESMPEFQVNGQFSINRFQQLLSTSLMSAGDFLSLIRTTLLIDQPRLGIMFSSFALPNEVQNTVALVNQERDVDYVIISRNDFLKAETTVSQADIEAYYKEHAAEFKTPEQLSLDYVELSIKDLMSNLNPSDDAMQSYYNDNMNSFMQPTQWNLSTYIIPLNPKAAQQDIAKAMTDANAQREEFNRGKAFPGVVSKFSTLAEIPQELQKSVSSLSKVGQISEPVQTSKGIVMVKVLGIKEAQVLPFDKVKDKVKEALTRQQAEEKYAEAREKLANVTYETPDSLAPAAKALGLTVKSTGLFTKDKGGNDIFANNKIREVAFSPDVFSSQNNSDVIQLTPDSAVVVRIKSHIPAASLNLATVQNQIVEQLKVKNAETKAAAMASGIEQKLTKGEPLDAHYAWSKLGFIGRYSTKIDSAILDAAFRLAKPAAAGDSRYGTVKIPQGYAVVALRGVRDGSVANHEQEEVFAEQIQNSEGGLEYKLYEQSLRKNAKIVSYVEQGNQEAIV